MSFIQLFKKNQHEMTNDVTPEQITEIVDQVNALATAQDFSQRLHLDTNHPLFPIAEAMNRFIDTAEQTTVHLTEGVSDVVDKAVHEGEFINNVDQHAKRLSESMEEVTASSQQLATSIDEITNFSQQATEYTNEASQKSKASKSQLETSFKDAEVIHNGVESVNQDVKRLNEKVESINNMVTFISDIADQTNLLALNASIEAARAGEHGKGFAVVASEVRKLSEVTRNSVDDITSNVSSIQKEVSSATKEMEDLTQKSRQNSEALQKTGSMVDEALHSMDDALKQINQIAPTLEEQSAISEEVTATIEQMNSATKETSSNIQETSHNIFELGERLDNLRTELGAVQVSYTNDQIIELAKTDHLLWVWRLENMLKGFIKVDREFVRDHTACRLGQWFKGDGQQHFGHMAAFQQLDQPHKHFHELCLNVIDAYDKGNDDDALEQFDHVKALSHDFLSQLDGLKQAIR